MRSYLAVAALEADKLPKVSVWFVCYHAGKQSALRESIGSDRHVHVLNSLPAPISHLPFRAYALNPVLGGCALRKKNLPKSQEGNVWWSRGLLSVPLDEVFVPMLDEAQAQCDLPSLFG